MRRFFGSAERSIRGRRNRVARHEGLGIILGALEPRCRLRWPEDPEARRAERVDDALREGRFWTDDGQCDLLGLRQRDQIRDRGDSNVGQPRLDRRAGVAGRDEDLSDARGLRDLPCQRVLTAAAADDEHVHCAAFLNRIR